jgi:hypothetical protein
MGFLEALTLIFIVLKLMGTITWSWWLVLLPEIIAVGLYILWFVFAVIITKLSFAVNKTNRKRR